LRCVFQKYIWRYIDRCAITRTGNSTLVIYLLQYSDLEAVLLAMTTRLLD
jgi:hypothetical protein